MALGGVHRDVQLRADLPEGQQAPALAAFLVRRTGDTLAPAWYATVLTVVALACVLLAPETADRPLDAVPRHHPQRVTGPARDRPRRP